MQRLRQERERFTIETQSLSYSIPNIGERSPLDSVWDENGLGRGNTPGHIHMEAPTSITESLAHLFEIVPKVLNFHACYDAGARHAGSAVVCSKGGTRCWGVWVSGGSGVSQLGTRA
eukprot:364261-Chlamydomonas_euryale.AAC.4